MMSFSLLSNATESGTLMSPLQLLSRFRQGLLLSTALAAALSTSFSHAGTLSVGIVGDMASLDPAGINGASWENDVLQDIYEGLVTTSASGELIPGAASHWHVSPDGKTWTFTLRDDARWSDGTPVTADDFVLAFRHQLDPSVAASYANMFYPIRHAQEVNAGKLPLSALGVESHNNGRTVVIQLEHPTPYILRILAHGTASPLPSHLMAKDPQWKSIGHLVTNGAYTPSEWSSQSYLLVQRNPAFHDAPNVSYDSVTYYITDSRQTAIMRFRSHALDIARTVPAERLQWLQQIEPRALHVSPMLGSYFYAFNTANGHPTSDPRVREALSLAATRATIANQVLAGGFVPSYALVPASMTDYSPQQVPDASVTDANARMDRARQLLKDAGYDQSHPLTLKLRYDNSEDNRKSALALAAMWQRVGVKSDLEKAEPPIHHAAIHQGDFDVARAKWDADYDDAMTFLDTLTSWSTNNYSRYRNSTYDSLITQAVDTVDPTLRRQLLEQAEQLAMKDYALLPLMTQRSLNLVSPDITGWQDNALDVHLSRWIKPATNAAAH